MKWFLHFWKIFLLGSIVCWLVYLVNFLYTLISHSNGVTLPQISSPSTFDRYLGRFFKEKSSKLLIFFPYSGSSGDDDSNDGKDIRFLYKEDLEIWR